MVVNAVLTLSFAWLVLSKLSFVNICFEMHEKATEVFSRAFVSDLQKTGLKNPPCLLKGLSFVSVLKNIIR